MSGASVHGGVFLAGVMHSEGRSRMSKGDELWEKREKVLQHLYNEGAIAPDAAVAGDKVREAVGMKPGADFNNLLWSVQREKVVGERGLGYYLTPDGFREAAGLGA